MNFGVETAASFSFFSPVSAIQATGKKKMRTMIQVSRPSISRVEGRTRRSARVIVRALIGLPSLRR